MAFPLHKNNLKIETITTKIAFNLFCCGCLVEWWQSLQGFQKLIIFGRGGSFVISWFLSCSSMIVKWNVTKPRNTDIYSVAICSGRAPRLIFKHKKKANRKRSDLLRWDPLFISVIIIDLLLTTIIRKLLSDQIITFSGYFPKMGCSKQPDVFPHNVAAVSASLRSRCLAKPHGVSQTNNGGGYFSDR